MAVFIFVIGSIIGSFLNVCIYRIPAGRSIVSPGSGCPGCSRRLAWFELIPLLSYLGIRGHCRTCGCRVSLRYPLVEAMTGAIYVAAYRQYGINREFGTFIILASLLTVITFIDIDHQIIPNNLVLTGLVAGFVLGMVREHAGLLFMAAGLAAGFGIMLLVAVASRGQMGWGDVKLSAVLGIFLGWQAVLVAVFFAFVSGAIFGLYLMVIRGQSRKTAVPFGPFLAGASLVSFLWSGPVIAWYLNLIAQHGPA